VDMAAARKRGGHMGSIAQANDANISANALDVGVIPNCPSCDETGEAAAESLLNVTVQKGNKCLDCIRDFNNSTDSS